MVIKAFYRRASYEIIHTVQQHRSSVLQSDRSAGVDSFP